MMFTPAPEPIQRAPLAYDELRETIELTLWAAQLLIQSGAESSVVERVVHRLGTGLGADWLDVFLSTNAVTISISSGGEFRTRTRRVISAPVNLTILAEIAALSRRSKRGLLTRDQLRDELRRISIQPQQYPSWMIIAAIGLACGAFSQLFGGDIAALAIAWVSASCAMFVRQQLAKLYFNNILVTIITAFVAGALANALALTGISTTPRAALAASVLLLVPGVALINGAEDLIKGYTVTGVARAVQGGLISLAIALGLLTAVSLLGGQGL
jgi:uncharacterized membrane protein YjjP (DUF1212 family)